jgi:hypothetical protein
MRMMEGDFGYDIALVRDADTGQFKGYRFTVYRCIPEETALLSGEMNTLHEAQAEAERYLKIASETARLSVRGQAA